MCFHIASYTVSLELIRQAVFSKENMWYSISACNCMNYGLDYVICLKKKNSLERQIEALSECVTSYIN